MIVTKLRDIKLPQNVAFLKLVSKHSHTSISVSLARRDCFDTFIIGMSEIWRRISELSDLVQLEQLNRDRVIGTCVSEQRQTTTKLIAPSRNSQN